MRGVDIRFWMVYTEYYKQKGYKMKMWKRFYEITVTSPKGKLLHKSEEYSGYSTSEELMYLDRKYPDCKVEAEFKELQIS